MRKNRRQPFGTRLRRHEAEPWRNQSRALAELFCWGHFPPGGGNHHHRHHQRSSHRERAISISRGKFFVPFGAGLGICFSQTRASHNKPDGSSRERPTIGAETISIASYCFQKNSRVNIEQQECCVNFWDFSGFVWTFLCIN